MFETTGGWHFPQSLLRVHIRGRWRGGRADGGLAAGLGWGSSKQEGGAGWTTDGMDAHQTNPGALIETPNSNRTFRLGGQPVSMREGQRRKPSVGNLSATGASRIDAPRAVNGRRRPQAAVVCVPSSLRSIQTGRWVTRGSASVGDVFVPRVALRATSPTCCAWDGAAAALVVASFAWQSPDGSPTEKCREGAGLRLFCVWYLPVPG